VQAEPFTISGVETRQQLLNGSEEGIIEAGGELKYSVTDSPAIQVSGSFNEVTNNGSVSTTLNDSRGITLVYSDDTTITNSKTGTISTVGTNSHGIYSLLETVDDNPDNIDITNRGTIAVEGSGSVGIMVLERTWALPGPETDFDSKVAGLTTTINNDGGTISAADGEYAIKVETQDGWSDSIDTAGGTTNLYLRNGSTITGNIDLGTGIDVVTIGNSNGIDNTGLTETVNGNFINFDMERKMKSNSMDRGELDELLRGFDNNRRTFLKKLIKTSAYVTPAIMALSMKSLEAGKKKPTRKRIKPVKH